MESREDIESLIRTNDQVINIKPDRELHDIYSCLEDLDKCQSDRNTFMGISFALGGASILIATGLAIYQDHYAEDANPSRIVMIVGIGLAVIGVVLSLVGLCFSHSLTVEDLYSLKSTEYDKLREASNNHDIHLPPQTELNAAIKLLHDKIVERSPTRRRLAFLSAASLCYKEPDNLLLKYKQRLFGQTIPLHNFLRGNKDEALASGGAIIPKFASVDIQKKIFMHAGLWKKEIADNDTDHSPRMSA